MRLIDADALLKKCIEGDGDNQFTEGYNFAVQEISAYITLAPTIDAEPVRHGRWILCEDQHGVDNDNDNYAYFCSQCHYQDVHSKYAKVNFCWNCGARMDGGADNGFD